MMNKMKKSFVLALGVALCLVFAGTAFAIDDASLESRTTEELYDRTDPFDLAMQPGLLYKLDRWRLYTNLSGYSGDDDLESDSYLIGTSGKLGAGSLAVFYETNKSEWESTGSDTSFYREDRDFFTVPETYPNYDGKNDYLFDYASTSRWENDREENNFHVAYSMDFGGISVGLSYAPEFISDEETVHLDVPDYIYEIDNTNDARNAFYNTWFFGWNLSGSNFTRSDTTRNYLDEAHADYYKETSSESFSGKREGDEEFHPIYLQSQIHTAHNWHLLAGIFYADIQEDDDVSGAYTGTYREENTDTGYLYTGNLTFSVDGARDEEYDGDVWGIYLEPVYEVNDMVSLRMDLSYWTLDGDVKGEGLLGTLSGTATERDATDADLEKWTVDETWNGLSNGDSEEYGWEIEPRVYLTFDRVRFALGVGYEYEKEEENGTTRMDKSVLYTYDDNDGVDTVDAWKRFEGSWTEYEHYDVDTETTTWRFPVAAEFDVTDKLTFRAGAAYSRTHREHEEKRRVDEERQGENYTSTDETGKVLAVGPDQYYATATATPTAYDATKRGESSIYKYDSTSDVTSYNLGLGYTFTENLKCDLMWTGKGDNGGVDMSEVFASVTLSF